MNLDPVIKMEAKRTLEEQAYQAKLFEMLHPNMKFIINQNEEKETKNYEDN